MPHRYPLLPIALSAEVPTLCLLRLKNGHPVGQPLRFISKIRLSYSEQRVRLPLSLSQATTTGLAGLHLWPDWPTIADRALWVLAALTASASMMFVSATAAIPARSKIIHCLLMAGRASLTAA